jgi:F-type H+-transporting ATPase subunit a
VAEHTSPLHQFEIQPYVPIHIGSLDLSFTNSAFFMLLTAAVVTLFMVSAARGADLVPSRLQSMAELLYEFVAGMVRDNVGHEGKRYFPFIFTLFMFILFGNLLGMLPLMQFGFTFTSHIIVTFAMALLVFLGVTAIGFARHGLHFFTLFVPQGVPKVMLLLLVPIEIISYLIRPITLSVRLFANMMAGHTMLVIFAGFVASLGAYFIIPGLVPLAATTAFMFLEILVAVLQAYVFTILTCIYLHDAIHLH